MQVSDLQNCVCCRAQNCHKLAYARGVLCFAAIGSGGPYALAAARALIDLEGYDAKTIGKKPRSS